MRQTTFRAALGAAAFLVFLGSAQSHPLLEPGAILVPHGPKGEAPIALRVGFPEGVIAVKKAGWMLAQTRGAHGKLYGLDGKPATQGAREIVWTEGRLELADEGHDPHQLESQAPIVRVAAAQTPKSYKAGAIVIEGPWARATPGGAKVAGGFMRITNKGAEPDRLVGGTLPLAGRFQVHESSMSGDVARMRPAENGLEIKPGQTVELKPGGFHVMFLDLKGPLEEGQTLKGTLVFEKAGTVAVEYAIRAIGTGPNHEHRH